MLTCFGCDVVVIVWWWSQNNVELMYECWCCHMYIMCVVGVCVGVVDYVYVLWCCVLAMFDVSVCEWLVVLKCWCDVVVHSLIDDDNIGVNWCVC